VKDEMEGIAKEATVAMSRNLLGRNDKTEGNRSHHNCSQ
jgi:hypothetical protein